MSENVIIVDYGCGNLVSIQRRLKSIQVDSVITSDPKKLREASRLILPGVGHFNTAMQRLHSQGLVEALNEAVLTKQVPVLGICLGMQLMARCSEEGNLTGLGWLDAEVCRFRVRDRQRYKVPHTGWNTVKFCRSSPLLRELEDGCELYFIHAYHWSKGSPETILAETEYDYSFPSIIGHGSIFGVQFHPEKSHDVGLKILRNFVTCK